MNTGVCALGLLAILGFSGVAAAQEQAPPPHRGFQLALRTGYAVPLGKLEQNSKMSDATSGQVPFIVDLGGKPIPELFLGGYFGLSFGGEAGAQEQFCTENGGNCLSVGVIIGVEAQYQILPGAKVDPWFGYGIGIESLALSEGGSGNDSASFAGVQFARLSGGVDFRLTRTFGIGPFIDYSLGKYSTANVNSESRDIPDRDTHAWLTIGARFVFFP